MTDERSKKELKPCPFCGSPATEPEKISQAGRPLWRTGCVLFCVSMTRGSKSLLKQDWNTRTSERLAKIEVLEEVRDKSEYKMNPEMYRFFTERIAELKEEGE